MISYIHYYIPCKFQGIMTKIEGHGTFYRQQNAEKFESE